MNLLRLCTIISSYQAPPHYRLQYHLGKTSNSINQLLGKPLLATHEAVSIPHTLCLTYSWDIVFTTSINYEIRCHFEVGFGTEVIMTIYLLPPTAYFSIQPFFSAFLAIFFHMKTSSHTTIIKNRKLFKI